MRAMSLHGRGPDDGSEGEQRHQGASTRAMCASAMFLALASAVVVTLWMVAFSAMERALEETAFDARSKHIETASHSISVLLGYVYAHSYTLGYHMRGQLLSSATFADDDALNKLVPLLFTNVAEQAHLSSVAANGSVLHTHSVIASGIMFADTSPRNIDHCTNASFVTVVRSPADSSEYMSDVQFYRPPVVNASGSGEDEAGGMARELRAYDVERKRLGPVISPLPVLGCKLTHAPYWAGKPLSKFGNFTWIGPYDPQVGWGMHLEGNVPVIGPDGTDIGRVGMAVSLRGLTAILIDALRRGGDITAGGHALIVTRSELLVLGNTEESASVLPSGASNHSSRDGRYCTDTYGCTVESLPNASLLADAVRVVRQHHGGVACPEAIWLASAQQVSNGRLVSLQPFEPGRYGLPPLQDGFCIVTSIPAANVLAATSRARFLSSMVAIAGGVGILLAMISLGCALAIAKRRMLALEREKAHRAERFVTAAMASLSDVSYPIVLLSFEHMVAAGRMRSHEELRAQNRLLLLDTLEQLADFQAAGNRFVFVSHQWLSAAHPDPEREQYHALVAAMSRIMRGEVEPKPLQPTGAGQWWVWIDYASVPQVHKGLMETAVSSLPVYASRADLFVILAPESAHESGAQCGLSSYFSRGWCRAEVLAKVCESGLSRTYILSSHADALNSTTPSAVPSTTPSEAGRRSRTEPCRLSSRGSRGDNERGIGADLLAVSEADSSFRAAAADGPAGAMALSPASAESPRADSSIIRLSTSGARAGGGGGAVEERLLRLEAFTQQRLSTLSLNVFEGSFKEEADKQRLVGPVLALYGNILRSLDPHAVWMRLHIQEQRDRFFPASQVGAGGRRTLLFNDYPARIEARVEAELAESRRLDAAVEWSMRSRGSAPSRARKRPLSDLVRRLRGSRGTAKVGDSPQQPHALGWRQGRGSVEDTSDLVDAAYPAGSHGSRAHSPSGRGGRPREPFTSRGGDQALTPPGDRPALPI